MGEPDRVEFEAHGLPCLMVRGSSGGWCGYAAVFPGHAWHGKDYETPDVRVHGGLTYAGKCSGAICHVPKPGEPDDVWWFGFHCAHSGDLSPNDAKYTRIAGFEETYKDVAYVRCETERLAKQLVELTADEDW